MSKKPKNKKSVSKSDLIQSLKADLANEMKHMMFYLHSASMVTSLDAAEIKEFLLNQAKSEMDHVHAFADMIVGLGGDPIAVPNKFPLDLTRPKEILNYALDMELEVIDNYVERINQAEEVGGADGKWVEIFLEDQIADSRTDADYLKQLLR